MAATFLEAEWRKLVMANYAVDPVLLEPYLPSQTVLDLREGICYLSLVGFMFQNTRVKGFRIPFHINFEEVNLRFYVKHRENGQWKRGVVFLQEIVPRPALSFVARTLYKEPYITLPMSHLWQLQEDRWHIEYRWGKGLTNTLSITTGKEGRPIAAGSEEEFITEHYWGYTRMGAGKTAEYEVEHPRWAVYETKDHLVNVNFGKLYGAKFDFLKEEKPLSVFLAEGSPVKVKKGATL